ncbi:MAG: hypothetical protein ACRCTE_08845 [Cellulosilyticaceae bacterium]
MIPCRTNLEYAALIDETTTCNANMQIILLAIVATFMLGSCLNKGKKELYGNLLLMVGQVLIITAL